MREEATFQTSPTPRSQLLIPWVFKEEPIGHLGSRVIFSCWLVFRQHISFLYASCASVAVCDPPPPPPPKKNSSWKLTRKEVHFDVRCSKESKPAGLFQVATRPCSSDYHSTHAPSSPPGPPLRWHSSHSAASLRPLNIAFARGSCAAAFGRARFNP